MKVTKNGKNLRLSELDFGAENFKMLGGFPGYHKWCQRIGRTKLVRINAENIQYIMTHWATSEWDEEANAERVKIMDHMIASEEVKQMKGVDAADLVDDSGYVYKRPPMDHQKKAFIVSRDKEAFAFLLEQGLGKTKVTLDTAGYLYQQGKIDMLIVVVYPNGLQTNWVKYELPEDLNVPYEAHFWSSKHKTKRQQKEFDRVHSATDKLKVMAFNAEAFSSQRMSDAKLMLLKCLKENRCLFVVDQSACMKNPSSQRTKFLLKTAKKAPYRRILDGNACAEGAVELFSQYKFLDENIIGLDTFTAFKAEYCVEGYFREVKGYKNLDKLFNKIDGHSFRMLTEDCIDLPKRSYMRFPFNLNPAERRIFDELKDKSLAFFDNNVCLACEGTGVEGEVECPECEGTGRPPETKFMEQQLALVKNMRLQQISSGWWANDEGGVEPIEEGKTPSRMAALKSLIENIEGKALIFARFKADLLAIQEFLGDSAVSYHGSISQDDREINKHAFKTNDKVRFIVGQIRVLGIGHTLTEAEHVIFYNNDHSLRFREEGEKRVHRTGLKHQVKVWDLVAQGTQDDKIIYALRNKKKVSNSIMKDPDTFFLQS